MKSFVKNFISKAIYKTVLLTITGILLANAAKAQRENFSGDWKLNQAKTDFGRFGEASKPVEMKISQTKDTLVVERISKSKKGEIHSYTERLPLDGQMIEVMNRTTKKIASIKWLNDKNSLVETADYKDDSVDISYIGIETWVLSDGGKTLTISRVDDGDDGHSESKMIYEK